MLIGRRFRRLSVGLVGGLSACAATGNSGPLVTPLVGLDLTSIPVSSYPLTPETAEIGFAVKPIGVGPVLGEFGAFTGALTIVDAVTGEATISAIVDTRTVQTEGGRFIDMIKGEGWFDVETWPEARFSGRMKGWDADGNGVVEGEMTIRDVTQPETFTMRLTCDSLTACPSDEVGFSGLIEVSRFAYGMTRLRGVVGDKVTLSVAGTLALNRE